MAEQLVAYRHYPAHRQKNVLRLQLPRSEEIGSSWSGFPNVNIQAAVLPSYLELFQTSFDVTSVDQQRRAVHDRQPRARR
jgi:hypothetical protein